MKTELSAIVKRLTILGVAQTAAEAMLANHLRLHGGIDAVVAGATPPSLTEVKDSFDQMKAEIVRSVYWSDFSALAKAGEVPADWLDGSNPSALGRVVLNWARQEP